jgi:hypothetical protein
VRSSCGSSRGKERSTLGATICPLRPILAISLLAACSGGAPSPRRPVDDPPPPPEDPLAASALVADVGWLCNPARAGRGSYQPGAVAAADYIERAFEEAGLEVVRQPIIDGGIDNVIGIRRAGRDAVLVSAHYDHLGVDTSGRVFPGADDNASGAAVLLGLARTAATRSYRHTILFAAFGAEEVGLVGSGVYVARPVWPLERTVAVLNFDMVGRNFFEWGSNREAAAGVVGLEGHPELLAAARRAGAEAGLDLIAVPAHLVELFGFEDRTDEWWFRRRGMLAIHISTSLHDDYHKPSDTPDRLVPAQLERVARTSAGLLDVLAARKK